MNHMDGFLNINKPGGITSFGVVARARKITGEKRIGHGGTLDPAAVGILPILLGKATRMADYLHLFPKTYKARIELGVTTDTYDKEGTVVSCSDASHVTRDKAEEALTRFKGVVDQSVPAYSSAKFQGRPLYSLAREGISTPPRQKEIQIYQAELVSWQPPVFTVRIVCGKGTYIRALAHDLGQALGCGAVLDHLERETYGPFRVPEALSLEQLDAAARTGVWNDLLCPLDFLFKDLSRVILSRDEERNLNLGKGLELDSLQYGEKLDNYLPAYGPEGQFLGVLKQEEDAWRWHKVFRTVHGNTVGKAPAEA